VDLKVIEGGGKGRDHGPPPSWARRASRFIGGGEPGLRPVDLLLVAYLLVTGALLLAFPRNVEGWPLHVALRLVAIVAVFRVAAARPKRRVLRFLRDWYPIVAFLPLYAELHSLTNLFTEARHDAVVVAWESAIFGGQPSQTWRLTMPSFVWSEYLHLAYFAYYFVPTTLCAWLYARGDRARFSMALTGTLTVFLVCCLWYMAFPVVGPYHYFGHLEPSSWPGFFAPLAHGIVQKGSSLGTAFPSSHTAVAVCVWTMSWRLCRPAFWVLALIVPGLALATVYGGFHYAIDTIAGVVLGVAVAWVTPALHDALASRLLARPPVESPQSLASQGRGRS
jgi:membrane-associated phospholipid phosphatase